jgi:hypothetical protein
VRNDQLPDIQHHVDDFDHETTVELPGDKNSGGLGIYCRALRGQQPPRAVVEHVNVGEAAAGLKCRGIGVLEVHRGPADHDANRFDPTYRRFVRKSLNGWKLHCARPYCIEHFLTGEYRPATDIDDQKVAGENIVQSGRVRGNESREEFFVAAEQRRTVIAICCRIGQFVLPMSMSPRSLNVDINVKANPGAAWLLDQEPM